MKKLTTLLFALLFTAGLAFGQNNDATTSQNGNNNEANIEQTYSAGATSGMNEASVDQDGNGNKALGLTQVGAGNVFDATQNGSNNIITVNPEQGTNSFPSYDGEIIVSQTGSGNKVWDADQAGLANKLNINQHGHGNIANVEAQLNNPAFHYAGTPRNDIDIDQVGDHNQVGEYSSNGPGAYQQGYGNAMNITQHGGAKAGIESHNIGTPNATFFHPSEGGQGLIQIGLDNNMNINQGSGSNVVDYVLQNGNHNRATILQAAGVNSARVSQDGNHNTSNITQN